MNAAGLNVAQWIRCRTPEPWVGPASAIAADVTRVFSARRRAEAGANAGWLAGLSGRQERRCYVRALFRNLVRCNADVLGLSLLDASSLLTRVQVVDLEHLRAAVSQRRGVVLVGAHLGNFELGVSVVGALGVPSAVIVESISPTRDRFLGRLRARTGVRIIPTADAPRTALRTLRSGGVLMIAGDRPMGSPRQLEVPFGRGRRSVPTGPAWLALRSGAPVVTASLILAGDGPRPYRLQFDPAVSTVGLDRDSVDDLTRRIAIRLSAAAVRNADQWFVFDSGWVHH